jgi:hypothetical protein
MIASLSIPTNLRELPPKATAICAHDDDPKEEA